MKSPFKRRFRGISPFGPGAGNGLTVVGRALSFLATAQPYTVTGADTISVADSLNAGGTYGIAISISSGTISLSGTTGLSFSVGDGTADAAMTFTGSLTNINTALDGLSINGASAGSRTITVTFSHAATSRTVGNVISVTVGAVPANSVAPVISGTLEIDEVLTVTDGTWTGTPAPTFEYQWQRNGSDITGEIGTTYTVVNDDLAAVITCEVTGTNQFGFAVAESNAISNGTYAEVTAFAFPAPVTISVLSTDAGKVAAANSTAVTFFLAEVAPTYDYYVNSYTGSDSNDGLTPGTAFATVTAADTAIGTSTGKSIGIKSGTSYNETLYLTSASTTVGVY